MFRIYLTRFVFPLFFVAGMMALPFFLAPRSGTARGRKRPLAKRSGTDFLRERKKRRAGPVAAGPFS